MENEEEMFWHKTMMCIIGSDFYNSEGEYEEINQFNYNVAIGVIRSKGDLLETVESKEALVEIVDDFISETLEEIRSNGKNLFINSAIEDVCCCVDSLIVADGLWEAVQEAKGGTQ